MPHVICMQHRAEHCTIKNSCYCNYYYCTLPLPTVCLSSPSSWWRQFLWWLCDVPVIIKYQSLLHIVNYKLSQTKYNPQISFPQQRTSEHKEYRKIKSLNALTLTVFTRCVQCFIQNRNIPEGISFRHISCNFFYTTSQVPLCRKQPSHYCPLP